MAGVLPCRLTCPHCGRELSKRTIAIFGTERTVTDYGSCGCEESKWDGEPVARADRRYAATGIPARYASASCPTNGWEDAVASGRSLYIHGPFGSGKTYFACSLAKKLCDMGVTGFKTNYPDAYTEWWMQTQA